MKTNFEEEEDLKIYFFKSQADLVSFSSSSGLREDFDKQIDNLVMNNYILEEFYREDIEPKSQIIIAAIENTVEAVIFLLPNDESNNNNNKTSDKTIQNFTLYGPFVLLSSLPHSELLSPFLKEINQVVEQLKDKILKAMKYFVSVNMNEKVNKVLIIKKIYDFSIEKGEMEDLLRANFKKTEQKESATELAATFYSFEVKKTNLK